MPLFAGLLLLLVAFSALSEVSYVYWYLVPPARHCHSLGVSRKLRPRKHRPQTSDLENTDLENTDLENTDLENTDLENTDLENPDLAI